MYLLYSASEVVPQPALPESEPEPPVATPQAQPIIRESMVKNAVEFLQEPRVAPSPGRVLHWSTFLTK
jgi:hypothetical protein